MGKTKKIEKPKQYLLSTEERTNLRSRNDMVEYLAGLVKHDMNMYINTVVRKRLGLEQGVPIDVNIETGIIQLVTLDNTDKKE